MTAPYVPYDVLIIGGGPAGSTAAILLAQKGRKVLVVEKERFPRFHIGESMLPNSMETFERLGVKEKLDRICLPKVGAEFATVCGHSQKFEFKNAFLAKHPQAYQVDRARFDKVLLDHARESGAEVLEETAAERFEESGDLLRVSIRKQDSGASRTVESKFLLDCSGRHTVIGNLFDLKRNYAFLRKIAFYAHYENVERDAEYTRIVRGKGCWFWVIPITDKLTSVGVVMDVCHFQKLEKNPQQTLEEALRAQPMLWGRMGQAKRATAVHSTGDYSYRNTRFAGRKWLMAGDAAGFIDPIFSTGVFLAVMSGEKAADTLDAVLGAPGKRKALFAKYQKELRRVMNLYLRFVRSWYTQSFAEVFASPTERLHLTAAINSVLAGNMGHHFAIRWRLELFYLVVFLQRFFRITPALPLTPGSGNSHLSKPQNA